jgi:hypothetical protein
MRVLSGISLDVAVIRPVSLGFRRVFIASVLRRDRNRSRLDTSDRVAFDASSRRAPIDRRTRAAHGALTPQRCPVPARRRVLRLRGLPFVAVRKAADFWNRDDRPSGLDRHEPGIRRILLESQMRATSMIVLAVEREDALQMGLVEHDHVIQAFATD